MTDEDAAYTAIPWLGFQSDIIRTMLDWLHATGVTRVDPLPYHTLGRDKYQKMGRFFTCEEHMLADDDLETFHRYALSLGMGSKIGA